MPMRLRTACAIAIVTAAIAVAHPSAAADPRKVLRVASPDIDTLDPQQYNDDPSFQVLRAIYEPLYEWSYLTSPVRLAPVTAAGPPEITDRGLTWTVHLQHGIRFTDDPAFGGKPRELTAEDYVYSLKRWIDPTLRRGGAPEITAVIAGARALVDAAEKAGGKFEYDKPLEGLRALDRYTLQLKLTAPHYPVVRNFLTQAAVAREVVESARGDIRTRAIGTGPYRLKEWKRGSRIVLEANPYYRRIEFPTDVPPQYTELSRAMRGKALPQIGSVEVNVIEEELTRVLEFERGNLDYIIVRGEVAQRMLQDDKLKREYAERGVKRVVFPEAYTFYVYFNVADPVLGGMTPERIALRRAISLGIDESSFVKVVYAGQATLANQLVAPGTTGFNSSLPTKASYDPTAANALLNRFGYVKRDGAGFRMTPDGKPLKITFTLRSIGLSREIATLLKKNMDAIGVNFDFRITPFQDTIKELEAGRYQMYFGGYGGYPSGYEQLSQFYAEMSTSVNFTRFKLDAYDQLMVRYLSTPDDRERVDLAKRMYEITQAYAPVQPVIFRLENDFVQPWVEGFGPMLFDNCWKYLWLK